MLERFDTQQRLVERRYTRDEIRLVLFEQLRVALWIEARDEQAAPPLRKHGVDAYAQSEAMEDRHDSQHLVPRLEHRVRRDDLLSERVEIQI